MFIEHNLEVDIQHFQKKTHFSLSSNFHLTKWGFSWYKHIRKEASLDADYTGYE